MSTGRILALDFGTVRIGVAISDPSRTIASPIAVVPAGRGAIAAIASIAAANDVGEILVGLPLNVDNSDSAMTKKVRAFADHVHQSLKLPVTLYDERYSSMIAHDLMIASGHSRKKRQTKGELDKRAAAAMLQEYLNSLADTG
jgi:putative Holliday junction resolvase